MGGPQFRPDTRTGDSPCSSTPFIAIHLSAALRELLPRLDPAEFWQIHRGTVVRASAIDSVNRDEAGKLSLRLRRRSESLPVSRLYAQRFRAM